MEEGLLIALRLSKEGFGSPEAILAMGTDTVMAALEYTDFVSDYQETISEINRE